MMDSAPHIIRIIVSEQKDRSYLALRGSVFQPDIMKEIINAALEEKPILILPKFTRPMQSLCSLMEKDILEWDRELKQYRFKI